MTGRLSADRFAATVRTVVAGLGSEDTRAGRAGAFRARGINVLDVNSLRHMRFRGVCVVGLAERSFPPAPRQDPLLLDQEREELNASQGWGLPLRARGADPKPLQFALPMGAATDRLQLSYPRTERGSGRPLYPSGFLRAAAQALAGERISAEALDDREDAWFERLPAGSLGGPSLDDALHRSEYDRTLLEQQPQIAAARRAPRAARHGAWCVVRGRTALLARRFDRALTPFDAGLSPAAPEALAGHPRLAGALPPTALETFALCSLKFFFDRVLLARARGAEDLPSISPLERSTLVHKPLIAHLPVRDHRPTVYHR